MFLWNVVSLFIVITMVDLVYVAYTHVGCYTNVFYDSYFKSPTMEPEMCFLLCETPVVYIRDTVCRCSGSGLMDNNRVRCDRTRTYSAYVEEDFHRKHAHLFNYQLLFTSCELWNKSNVHDTLQVNIEESFVKSPLVRLEQCAATCLDRKATTKSIAFNGDNKQCLCILPRNLTKTLNITFSSTIFSHDRCNRYCNDGSSETSVQSKFKCGSLTDPRIWAVYRLRQVCSIHAFYIEELEECVYPYETRSYNCPRLTRKYVYDGNVKWDVFLKAIDKLNLTESAVNIDFDGDVTVDASWKCSTKRYFEDAEIDDYSIPYAENSPSSNYLLKNGCLYESSYSSYSFGIRSSLCIEHRSHDSSSSSDVEYEFAPTVHIYSPNAVWYTCPSDWLDINKNCYQISANTKTIQEAKSRCIDFTQDALANVRVPFRSAYGAYDDNDDDEQEVMNISKAMIIDTLKGEIAQYTYEWEARLGFYLLDKRHMYTTNSSFLNEFQMINPNEANTSSARDDSCLVVSRTKMNGTKRTKPILDLSFKIGCFDKPLMLGLPAMISNHLTYELCLSVCADFQTNLAVINMNKCYCLEVDKQIIQNLKSNHTKFATKDCGNPCSGNKRETCGNANTIVALGEDESIKPPIYFQLQFDATYPNLFYENCIDLSSINQSEIYGFNLTGMSDVHPRHCVELCAYYKQEYSLLNASRCLCTNTPMKNKYENCNQECRANYLYTCGNTNHSNIYSVYYSKLKCPFNFRTTQDEKRCVRMDLSTNTDSFSTAQSYCQSIGGVLAKINDVLDIQDIFPKDEFNKYSRETEKYFWIDRTSDRINTATKSVRSIKRCFRTLKSLDQNCLILRPKDIDSDEESSSQWCLSESDQCLSLSAIPVCVARYFEFNPVKLPQTTNDSSLIISLNISTDYSCENDQDYHLIDGHCYKILFGQSTWNDARIQCERENAILFLPQRSTKLSLIKYLVLRHQTYRTSHIVHVGIYSDNQTRIVTQYYRTDESTLTNVSNVDGFDEICARKVNAKFEEHMSSPRFSIYEKDRIKNRQMRCAYIDFEPQDKESISCSVKSCDRLANVICQKTPIITTETMYAKIDSSNLPMNEKKSNGTGKSRASSVVIVLVLVTILFVLIIIGLKYAFQRRCSRQRNDNTRGTDQLNSECTYSRLLIKNESDLN